MVPLKVVRSYQGRRCLKKDRFGNRQPELREVWCLTKAWPLEEKVHIDSVLKLFIQERSASRTFHEQVSLGHKMHQELWE